MYHNNEPRFSRGEKQTENTLEEHSQSLVGPKTAKFLSDIKNADISNEDTAIGRFHEFVEKGVDERTIDRETAEKCYLVASILGRLSDTMPGHDHSLVTLAHTACWRAQELEGTGRCDVGVILRACQVWYRTMYSQNMNADQLATLSTAVGYVLITASCVKEADLKNGTVVVVRPSDLALEMYDALYETMEKYGITDMIKPKEAPEWLHQSRERCMRLMFTNDLPFEV